jgi:hypothetical protein
MDEIIKKIDSLMKEYHLYGDVYEHFERMIAVEISWGDWKHSHLRFKWMMEENFPESVYFGEKVTEEDGSDCYSAIHYFYFAR